MLKRFGPAHEVLLSCRSGISNGLCQTIEMPVTRTRAEPPRLKHQPCWVSRFSVSSEPGNTLVAHTRRMS